jgi:predicted deacylase
MTSFTRRDISVRKLATGHELTIPVFEFKGTGNGQKAYFQASMHGAELQGNAVIFELIQYFTKNPPLGDVTLVPHANPYGMNHKSGEYTQGRFDPTTGDNWNRKYFDLIDSPLSRLKIDSFLQAQSESQMDWKSVRSQFKILLLDALKQHQITIKARGGGYGELLALQLQILASEADLVLDLHTASRSVPYVYSPEYALESAAKLGMKYILSIPRVFSGALDEAIFFPWWHLFDRIKKSKPGVDLPAQLDVEAFTLELGQDEAISKEEAKKTSYGIIQYLAHKWNLPASKASNPTSQASICELKNFRTVFTQAGGLVEFLAPVGEILKKGQPLARILNLDALRHAHDIKSAESLIILEEDCIPIVYNRTASLHEGMELAKVFVQSKIGTDRN